MPYVQRTATGVITGIYSGVQPGIAEELVLDNAIELVAFLKPTYRQLRAAAYPPVADYLDAVVKGDAVALQAYKDACMAVKAKYPKV